jgi:predicted Zn finger-like uncharacterized protein
MSLVTRCPACTTTFKVVRDQLRISDGWVRCGRCSHVFDATLDLHEASDAPVGVPPSSGRAQAPALVRPSADAPVDDTSAAQVPRQSEPEAQQPPHRPEPSHAAEDADFFDEEPEHSHASPSPAPVDLPVPAAVAVATPPAPAFSLPAHGLIADEPWSDLDVSEPEWKPPAKSLPPFPNIDLNLAAPPPSTPPPAPPLPVAPRLKAREQATSAGDDDAAREAREKDEEHDQVQMQKALRRARAKSAKIASAKAREERAAAKAAASVVRMASEPEDASPSSAFGEPDEHLFSDEQASHGGSPGFWQRKAVQRALAVLVVLAIVLLVVQIVRHERDGIAARQPNLRPALATLCQYTGCELSALRQIGDIVIEGAAFAREKSGGNDYRLSFTLRNGATVPLAMPAVELSLLDTQERAVVRRVLMPADYGAPAVLPARADRAASLPLTLSATEAAALPPIAGYRVEAFYP